MSKKESTSRSASKSKKTTKKSKSTGNSLVKTIRVSELFEYALLVYEKTLRGVQIETYKTKSEKEFKGDNMFEEVVKEGKTYHLYTYLLAAPLEFILNNKDYGQKNVLIEQQVGRNVGQTNCP